VEDHVKITKLAAVGLAGVLLLAACGDDDDTTATGSSGDSLEAPAKDTKATLRVWLNGPDTPDEMREYAISEFNKSYPDVKVEIEEQEWDGIVNRLTNVLPTDDTPDIVEVGNTQAQQFEGGGAFVDLSTVKDDLGGDDLLPGLVDSGTYDEKFYGLPLYAGARIVTYRTDLFEAAGLQVPTTMDEFIAAGKTLQTANAGTPNFSGIYFPGRNWQAMLSFIWDAGGDLASGSDADGWDGLLADDDSVKGLETVADIMKNANQAPADSDDRNDFTEFCAGEIGMLIGPGWKPGQILGEDGCPDTMTGKIATFTLPGSDGSPAPVFLGGSNLGISAKSKNKGLAVEFLKIIASEGYQKQYAENGLIPALTSLLGDVQGDDAVKNAADAAQNGKVTPSSERWAEVEGQNILQDMGTEISNGTEVSEAAKKANDSMVEILNG
jgi:N,N'-diacetylchitobiose transport system substrate-binding protein